MWPTYIINLAANTERLESSARQLAALGIAFERIDAANGWALSAADVAHVYDAARNRRRAKHPLVPPEIGCYLSHIEVWRRIADGSAEGGFIFEDDFHASDSLGAVLALLSEDRRDWDMAKLFTLDPLPKCVARRSLGPNCEIVVPYRVPACTLGYGVTREAARRLESRAIPFFRPVDEDLKFFWETGVRVALVLPAPLSIGDQRTTTGTIGAERRAAGRSDGVVDLVRAGCRLLHQLRYSALLHYHRLRKWGQ